MRIQDRYNPYLCAPASGLVLAHLGTVPERLNALQNNWADMVTDAANPMYYICLGSSAILVLCLIHYWMQSWGARSKTARKTLDIAHDTGLTQKEFKLLSVISANNKTKEMGRLLSSVRSFDEIVGAYLKRYCIHTRRPEPLLAALEKIRNKLTDFMGDPGENISGLLEIPLLARVEVANESREKNRRFIGQVVDRQFNRIRINGLKKANLLLWKPGDPLKIKCFKENGDHLEFLMKFRKVEFREAGFCLVEFGSSSSPAMGLITENCTLRYQVNIYQNRVDVFKKKASEAKAVLQWIGPEGAFLKIDKKYCAGDKLFLELMSADTGAKDVIEGKVYYSHQPSQGHNSMSLSFETVSEKAMRIIYELTNDEKQESQTVTSSS